MAKKAKQSVKEPTESRLLKQLAAAPIVDVLGVLSASGVGGGWSQGDTKWTVSFTFAAWRIGGGELKTKELIVRRLVAEKQVNKVLDRLREQIMTDFVTRIRARVVEKSVFGRHEALLVKVVGRDDSDAEINAEVERLKKPVRFKDKYFGTFTLDRTIDWFKTKATWNGSRIGLSLAASEPPDLERALDVARQLWRSQRSWKNKVLARAVKELLPLKNGLWLGDDEKKLSAKHFQERIRLERITVHPDGSFDFWHSDGDLFFGHDIEVLGSLTKGVTSAGIQG